MFPLHLRTLHGSPGWSPPHKPFFVAESAKQSPSGDHCRRNPPPLYSDFEIIQTPGVPLSLLSRSHSDEKVRGSSQRPGWCPAAMMVKSCWTASVPCNSAADVPWRVKTNRTNGVAACLCQFHANCQFPSSLHVRIFPHPNCNCICQICVEVHYVANYGMVLFVLLNSCHTWRLAPVACPWTTYWFHETVPRLTSSKWKE